MFKRKSFITLVSAALLSTVGFAAEVVEAETPGSAGPKAVAESIHNARVHGSTGIAPQPIAQAPGSEKAQAGSEAVHLPKQHGNINDSADQRMLRDAPGV